MAQKGPILKNRNSCDKLECKSKKIVFIVLKTTFVFTHTETQIIHFAQ